MEVSLCASLLRGRAWGCVTRCPQSDLLLLLYVVQYKRTGTLCLVYNSTEYARFVRIAFYVSALQVPEHVKLRRGPIILMGTNDESELLSEK